MLILIHASVLSEKFHKHFRFLISLLKSLYIKNDINQILVKDEHYKDSYSYYSKEQLLNTYKIIRFSSKVSHCGAQGQLK